MSLLSLFGVYSLAIVAASLLGGRLPTLVHLSHTRTQLIMSFVAGLMLGIAGYRLLPHAIFTLGGEEGAVERAVWWLMIGLLLMFILLRAFHFHQHEPEEVLEQELHHDHDHRDHKGLDHKGHDHQNHDHHLAHPLSWVGAAVGMTLHTLIDGIALGAAIKADAVAAAGGALSLGVFIAVLLHKPLDSMSIISLMRASGYTRKSIVLVNLVFALVCPLGALLFFWGADVVGVHQSQVVGSALAFSAGVFLCISLSDLLPEVQFHSHDSGKLTLALVLGLALAYGISHLEPEHGSHDHGSHAGLEHLPMPAPQAGR